MKVNRLVEVIIKEYCIHDGGTCRVIILMGGEGCLSLCAGRGI